MNEMLNDSTIYETESFIVCVPKVPHIPREDGGHIWIRSKEKYFCSRLDLSSKPNKETGFYDNFEPLNLDDINEIKKQIIILEKMKNIMLLIGS